MPLAIPSYVQSKVGVDTYRQLLSIAQYINSLEISFRDLNNHVASGGGAQQAITLTADILKQIEQALEATGPNPLNVDSLPGLLLDPQGAGIPTATVLPNINTVGPGQAYFVGGILYIANNAVNPPVWAAITSSTSPQANHLVLIGPVTGGPLTPTYRALALSDLPALSGVTITSPTIATGIAADGTGFKHGRTTTGSIALSTTVDITITFATTFANANFTPVVSIIDSSNQLQILGIKSQAAANIVVTVKNNDAGGAHTGSLAWIASHD